MPSSKTHVTFENYKKIAWVEWKHVLEVEWTRTWTAVPSVRIGTERYVARIFSTRFNLVRYMERISVRNLLVRYEVRILVRDFNRYGTLYGIWYEKCNLVRIFTYRNPYNVPYQVWLRTKFRTKYRTVPENFVPKICSTYQNSYWYGFSVRFGRLWTRNCTIEDIVTITEIVRSHHDRNEVHYSRSLTFTDDPLSRQTWFILYDSYCQNIS